MKAIDGGVCLLLACIMALSMGGCDWHRGNGDEPFAPGVNVSAEGPLTMDVVEELNRKERLGVQDFAHFYTGKVDLGRGDELSRIQYPIEYEGRTYTLEIAYYSGGNSNYLEGYRMDSVTLTDLESGKSLRLPQGDLEGFLKKERRESDAGESAAEKMPNP
ncbi:MAG: hypothetical protein HFJ79_10110 [Clostridiales bacterium]|jgi:hypothetical protein|nr:hypothetical protein [Clostridiales bacterium]